jgi:hypothetical protein
LIVSFQTREQLDQCASLEAAEQWLGTPDAQLLIGTLADIEAFDDASELINFFGNDAKILPNGFLSLPLGPNYRAMFVAVGAKLARSGDGSLDWTKIQRLKLVEISRC